MYVKPPCEISQAEITFKAGEIEAVLQGPAMQQPKFKPAVINVKGQEMVIREAKEDELEKLLQLLRMLLDSEQFKAGKDFYDIVGARVYAELLGVRRKRLKDPYLFVGLINGEIAALANGRLMNEDINISLHTMAFKRGLRAGASMFYAKCNYCFDILNQQEFWATYESYNGFKRWGLGMAMPSYPWPDVQHELGGAKVYYVTKKYWDTRIKNYVKDVVGSELIRPVPDELLKKNEELIIPDKIDI